MTNPDQEKLGQEVHSNLAPSHPFNLPPTLNLCDMRGVQMRPWRTILALTKGFELAAVNMSNNREEGASAVKRELLDTVATLALSLDPTSVQGFVKTTGTETNRAAIDYARKRTGKEGVVCSSLSHRSVASAAKGKIQIVPVQTQDYQMNPQALLDALTPNVGVLVLTAGTTELGIIEVLPAEVEARCKELGIWIHMDAAYGGMNLGMLPPEQKESQDIRQLAHSPAVKSIMVDTHKFVGPMECSLLFLRGESSENEPMYIPGATELSGSTKGSLIPYLTLEAIKSYGKKGLQEEAHQTYRAAKYLGAWLKHLGVETIVPVQSGIIPIKFASRERAVEVHEKMQARGFILADPLEIETVQGITHGVRLVFTPGTDFDPLFVEDLAKAIAAL